MMMMTFNSMKFWSLHFLNLKMLVKLI